MTENKTINTSEKLVTYADFANDIFAGFKNDKERIKYMSRSGYGKMNLTKSFEVFYGFTASEESVTNKMINNIINIELGKIYTGDVIEFTDRYISFKIPGVKEEIISKENFSDCRVNIENYLLTNNNKLRFEVREFVGGKYYVSVISAYYKSWVNSIEKSIKYDNPIDVHIDGLVNGGYLCHTDIVPLNRLTGRNYTHSVFIPGSHIVLNIERDFEKWIGETVSIIPQKFIEYKKNFKTGETEMSLVGSRKRVLQIIGNQYMYDIYNLHKLAESDVTTFERPVYTGTITGIINSAKKSGVFVELEDKYITGLLKLEDSDLLDFIPGNTVNLRIKEFEIQPGYEPFVIKNNKVTECHTRLVFELA